MKTEFTVFWYSQTGQSFDLAQRAGDVIRAEGKRVNIMPLAGAGERPFPAGVSLFVFPVHNFQPPVLVKRVIESMPRAGDGARAYLVLTYAGWAANTPHLFRGLLAKKNVPLAGHLAVRCRDSYIPFVKWLPFLDRKDLPDQGSFDRLEGFVREVVVPGKTGPKPRFNPLDPTHWMGAASPGNAPRMFLGKRVFVEKSCTLCRFCAVLCPSGAITLREKRISFDERLCLGCCGCMNICPENAWQSGRFPVETFFKGVRAPEMVKALKKTSSPKGL